MLSGHDWPGNLAELEALAGRLALEPGEGPIEAGLVEAMLGISNTVASPAGAQSPPRIGRPRCSVSARLNQRRSRSPQKSFTARQTTLTRAPVCEPAVRG